MSKTTLKFVALVMTMLMAQAIGFGAALSAKTVTGTVTSSVDNEPLIGATIQVEGTQVGAVTDFEGNFKIEANDGQTLVVSYIGYVTKKVKVGGQNNLIITLDEDKTSLEEVVVIGYGVQKKKLVTGATLQVKGDDVAKLNTTNPLQALQGQRR